MADETLNKAPVAEAATAAAVVEVKEEEVVLSDQVVADSEGTSSSPMTDKELLLSAPSITESEKSVKFTTVKEEDEGDEVVLGSRLLPPQSLISFKEESNKKDDLSDSEKKAFSELKHRLQEALNNHEFTFPSSKKHSSAESGTEPTSDIPPPPSETEIPILESETTPQKPATHESKQEENAPEKAVEAVESLKITEPDQQTPVEAGVEKEVAVAKAKAVPPQEVSIWGIPLLKDNRSDVILLKFLRARDFKVKEAFTMIKNTLRWRKANEIDKIVDEDLGEDTEKVVFMRGHDRKGHPVCYNVFGEFQNKELYQKSFSDEEKRMKFLRGRIQFLERSIRDLNFCPGGVCTIVQVNDLKNAPGPAKRELRIATKQALQVLQDNYPDFVAKQVFINVPWWYVAFYTMISPLMTQRSKSKFVIAGPGRSAETLLKYISSDQIPVQYGGLSVDDCDCNSDFTIDDPAIEITVKPGTKQTVEIIIYEKCTIVWELRVVGWEVSYGAEFVPNDKDAYIIVIQKTKKISPTDEPVVYNSFKVSELGKVLLTIDNPTSKKKYLAYRFIVKPLSD